MPVKRRKTSVALVGVCGPEEAEHLQAALLANPGVAIDIAKCEYLHSAILQVLMASGRSIKGKPQDKTLAQCIAAAIGSGMSFS